MENLLKGTKSISAFGKVGMNSLVAIDFMVDEPQAATIVRVK
jgi:hypothetical protein